MRKNKSNDKFRTYRLERRQYYVAQCLNVDVSSFGETKQEALTNLNEVLELYFEDFT